MPMNEIPFALFRNNFLPLSETFIHDELRFHKRYRGVVFTRRRMNESVFSGHEVHAANESGKAAALLYGATALHPPFFAEFFRRRFALVHAHFGHNGLYALPYAQAFRLPLVVTVHGRDVTILVGPDRFLPEFWHYAIGSKALFSRATLILAASTELAELLVEAGCPESRIRIHRLGIDLENFAFREREPEGILQVLMVGRLVPKKGFAFGLRAFAGAIEAGIDARLRIVGDGPHRAQLERLARELGISSRVTFSGALPHAEVIRAMRESVLLLAPSVVASNMDRESGLIVAKEASAVGVPVVAHWHGGLPDIVDDGVTGFLVPERDVPRMTGRIVALLRQPGLRASFGRAAREKMEREYDIRKTNERLENFYDEAIALWNRKRP